MDDARGLSFDTEGVTLVVDLDDTLVQTDMLLETFWSALSQRWRNGIAAARALTDGKAAFKQCMQRLGPIDPALLPYNPAVIDYVTQWRARGGRTALVSASDQRLVDQIATHLGLFDDVCGSDGRRNLKGPVKAQYLKDRYGAGAYIYVGDAPADLAVWRDAKSAVTVDVPPALAAQVAAQVPEVVHLTTHAGRLKPLIKAMRPHQWLKNTLVFLPMLAAHQFHALTLAQALLAFVVFSLVASSVYLLNDLLDLAADRVHPRKRRRPFASGALPLIWGTVLAPALLVAGLALALLLNLQFVGVMLFYYVVTTTYSFYLKRALIVDICTLAGLYTLRIIAGGSATGIPLSVWLLAFSMFFFLSLASMKRQAELKRQGNKQNKAHGRSYEKDDLPLITNMAVSSGYVSVLVMALYLNTDTVTGLYAEPAPLWGICLVLLYWLSRMAMISHRGWMHDDPVVFAARDWISIICALCIFGFATLAALW